MMAAPFLPWQSLDDLKRVAFHEAGHAVARLHFGHGIRRVTIVPNEAAETLGMVTAVVRPTMRPDWSAHDPKTYRWIFETAVIHFAGPAAEARHVGRRKRVHEGAGSDYSTVGNLAEFVCESSRSSRKWQEWVYVVAEDFVANPIHWVRIEAVAGALLSRPTLSGRRVNAVAAEAYKAKMPELPEEQIRKIALASARNKQLADDLAACQLHGLGATKPARPRRR